ncbi:Helix-turn-helix protein [Caballeronia sordidicola]|jgi:transcriptional regulator with XRE-family HTH domain|uniref:Helix-turn-helix protein n=2 Tax=Caballeronia sordidicola TaxID=196367 RepID=A0A226WYR9_CABSO|nr:Helix-turn-helix protein [Caballeronia sordidicola]
MARTLSPHNPHPNPLARDMSTLGALVRNRRLEQSLRIDDAADLLGVSSNVLSRLENGHPVGSDRLLRVLDGLGLTLLVLPRSESTTALRALGVTTSHAKASLPRGQS